ncbi:hypothetical protein [Sediminicoccus rosea]|uniref:Uncharacterized protein n=1 Tax=Sediminicoccus rosea TaxID=1225128 RepID=A0ABZ0PEP4_9PROT|nr:hypothetical protein [Sediminicoccus rosea]WPB83665.1 hypothetical protein R9Z33_16310 [Sediminicoccus rosea]
MIPVEEAARAILALQMRILALERRVAGLVCASIAATPLGH